MGFGTILWGLGAMIIALLYVIYPGDAKVNAWWIVLFYAVLMVAEGFTCPIGYSITAVAAPNGVNQLVQDAIRNQQSQRYDQYSGESLG